MHRLGTYIYYRVKITSNHHQKEVSLHVKNVDH